LNQRNLFTEMDKYDVKVREPRTGYDTKHKQKYRENLYKHIKESVHGDIQHKKLLFMPSNTDGEIKQALSIGIREENMWACDDNPAMLATAKWRKQYPRINILGSKLSRAIERLKEKNIKIDIVNLDLCTNLSQWMFDDVTNLIKFLTGDEILFAITLLKGRESSAEATLAKMLFKDMLGAADRISIVFNYIFTQIRIYGKLLLNTEYSSSKQKMCYGLMHFIHTDVVKNEIIQIYKVLHPYVRATLQLDSMFYVVKRYVRCPHTLPIKLKELKPKEERKLRSLILEQYWKQVEIVRKKYKNITENNYYHTCYRGYKDSAQHILIGYWHAAIKDYIEMDSMPYHRI